jgi:hypothetical protein
VTDEPSAPPELRASDTDREHTAEALRHAAGEGRLTVDELDERLHQAFAARTRSELERLVADVVPRDASGRRPLGVPEHRVPVRGRQGGSRWILSILGGAERRGRWRLAERAININFWGGSDLDLNDVELAGPDTELRVITIMGGADIHVPEGLNVEVSELAVMGANNIRLGDALPDPGGPRLRIKMFTLMGGSDVRRGPKLTRAQRAARKEQRRLDEQAEREGERRG